MIEVRRRRQQRRQPQKHNYPLRSLLLYVVINIALAFAMTSSTTTTAVIMEEEQQQQDNNNNNNVCTWSDEHGKEICANSKNSDGDGDVIDDDDEKKEPIEKKKKTDQFLPTSEGGREYFDDNDDDDDDDDDDDNDYSSGSGRNKNYDEGDEYLENYLEWPEEEKEEEFDVWIHGDKSELYYELQCDNQEQGDDDEQDEHITNIHTKEIWEIFNTVYHQILVESSTTTKQSTSSIPSKYDTNGYHYPIEIKYDPTVGRGVYALQDISKGSLLYTSINTATFLEGQTFRNFLKALSTNHHKKLACDVMIWSYVRLIKPTPTTVTGDNKNNEEDNDDDDDDDEYIYYDNSEDDYMICCDLDEGSFINSADYEYQYNMALGTSSSETTPGGVLYNDPTITNQEKIELWYGCEMKFYASQDIKIGDEIRADYSDFVESDGWKFLGL